MSSDLGSFWYFMSQGILFPSSNLMNFIHVTNTSSDYQKRKKKNYLGLRVGWPTGHMEKKIIILGQKTATTTPVLLLLCYYRYAGF